MYSKKQKVFATTVKNLLILNDTSSKYPIKNQKLFWMTLHLCTPKSRKSSPQLWRTFSFWMTLHLSTPSKSRNYSRHLWRPFSFWMTLHLCTPSKSRYYSRHLWRTFSIWMTLHVYTRYQTKSCTLSNVCTCCTCTSDQRTTLFAESHNTIQLYTLRSFLHPLCCTKIIDKESLQLVNIHWRPSCKFSNYWNKNYTFENYYKFSNYVNLSANSTSGLWVEIIEAIT